MAKVNSNVKIKLLHKIKNAIRQGLLHIFSTTVLNKIIALLTNIIIVRVLTKDEFGYFSYAYNIITTIMIFSSLGITNTILQYGCENKDNEAWLSKEKTLFIIGLVSNLLFSICTLLYAMFVPLSIPEGKYILMMLSILPIFQYFLNYETTKLRILEKNKQYALITNIQSIAYFVAACLGGYLFSLIGTTIGRCIGYLLPVLVGLLLVKREVKDLYRVKCDKHCKEELKYSFWVVLNNASSSIFYHLDVFVIGLVIADATILADYKVATQIPTALITIPMAIATFIYPKFVRNRNNPNWIKKNFFIVQLCLGVINATITIVACLLAPYIIKLIYGTEYAGAVFPFRLLMLSYFISGTFRTIIGHILSMLHQIKASFYIGIFACVVNILGDFLLISKYGSIGAAYATLLVVVLESIISFIYFLMYIRKTKKEKLR